MARVSNPKYFTTRKIPLLPEAGWEVVVCDFKDLHTKVAVITDYLDLTFTSQLSNSGEGAITVNLDAPMWRGKLPDGRLATALLAREYLWRVYQDGVCRFEFLGRKVVQNLVNTSEARTAVIAGPGSAEILRFAKILRPGWPRKLPTMNPQTATSDDVPALNWQFPTDWTAMRMWVKLFRVAQKRGVIPWVTLKFGAYTDAAHNKWQRGVQRGEENKKRLGYKPTPGLDLLDFLNECTGQDPDDIFAIYAEWMMRPGLSLDARRKIGTDRSRTVVFHEAGLHSKRYTETREDIHNYIVVIDRKGHAATAASSTSISRWNRRELLDNKSLDIAEFAKRNQLAEILRDQHAKPRVQWSMDVPAAEAGRLPFRNFNVGDHIGVMRYTPGEQSIIDSFRVIAITVHVEDDETSVELTLESAFDQAQKELERRLSKFLRRYKGGGNTDVEGSSTGGGGGTGGPRVFIQPGDPGTAAADGDFWLETYS